ncbi:MAG: lysoplasmalogenase [Novosphingobium sp.]
MPKRALIEKRPWLLASLIAGISFYFVKDSHLPGLYQMAWKGAGVALLAVYALVRHHGADSRQIAAVMGFGALGDVLIEIDMLYGALAFLAGHIVAIWLYARHRRSALSTSQRLLAIVLVPVVVWIAWSLPGDPMERPGIALYSTGLAVMAAMAWTSNFSRYRVGIGAMMFVASDLLIFSRLGPLSASALPGLLIWPLYYFGQFLICTGVIGELSSRATPGLGGRQ